MKAKRFYNLVLNLPEDSAFHRFLKDRNRWNMAAFNQEPEIE